MKFEHEKFGSCELADLSQKRMEDFHRAMQGKEKEVLSVFRGDSVRTAIKLDILVEPKMTVEAVDEAQPAMISWIAECIMKLFAEAMNLDPLS